MKKAVQSLLVAFLFFAGMLQVSYGQLVTADFGTTSYSSVKMSNPVTVVTTGNAVTTDAAPTVLGTFGTGISAATFSLTSTQSQNAGGAGYINSQAWGTSTSINTAAYWQLAITPTS